MSKLEEMLEMFATAVQSELKATLYVCESGLQDILTKRSNSTLNVAFQFLYGAWLVPEGRAYANKPHTIQELENNI
jgi:hypothetical protein